MKNGERFPNAELLAVFVVCSRLAGFAWLYRKQAGEPPFKTKVSFRGRVSHTTTPIFEIGLVFPKYTPHP